MSHVNKYTTQNIDFDKVRDNLKTYLQSQKEFTDYNFEGSGLSQLLNCLAYNTSYNLVYQNFAVNEAFLDTAYKKSSVISHANVLNYLPRSKRAPVAKVTITISGNTTSPTLLRLDAYSAFKTTVDGVTYLFYNLEDYVATKENNSYVFNDVYLYEGTIGYAGGMYNNDAFQNFRIEDSNIDTTTIKVIVDEQSEGINTFSLSTGITGVDSTSKVYFLRENPNETYQVEFGDGTLGQSLKYGDMVSITYLSTNGTTCNGAKNFTYASSLDSQYTLVGIVCTEPAVGGADSEDIESIRQNAPKIYTTQNRCVTARDYKATILAEYANAKGVNVWGGEDMTPPQYGHVFISIINKDETTPSSSEKEYILKNIINPKKPLATICEFYDPTFLKVNVMTDVYYDASKTTKTAKDVQASVTSAITTFMSNNLGSFDMDLKYSKLLAAIDDADASITNNLTSIELISELDVVYDVATSYSVTLNNAVKVSSSPENNVLSTVFRCSEYDGYECMLDDDPTTNKIRIFTLADDGSKKVLGNVGTIDYDTGTIEFSLTITKLESETFELFVTPKYNDVTIKENQFAILDESRLTVTVHEND